MPYDSDSATARPTSAVVNIVLALPYSVRSPPSLSPIAKIGIGVGSAIGGITIIVLLVLLILNLRKHKKDKNVVRAARDVLRQNVGASTIVASQSSTLLHDPVPKWAPPVEPQYPPKRKGTYPSGYDVYRQGGGGDGAYGGYGGGHGGYGSACSASSTALAACGRTT